jgi:hypothetical protein
VSFQLRRGWSVAAPLPRPAASHRADRIRGPGDTPSAFNRKEPLLRLRDVVFQLLDLRLEESFSRAVGIPIGFEASDRLSALSSQSLLTGLQSRSHARFQLGNPLLNGGDADGLMAILTDRQRKRLLGALQRVRRIPNLLIEKQECVPVGEVMLRRGGRASNEGHNRLER